MPFLRSLRGKEGHKGYCGEKKESFMYPETILVIGNIASGKTTVGPRITNTVSGTFIGADNIFFTIKTKDAYLHALSILDLPKRKLKKIPSEELDQLRETIINHELAMLNERVDVIRKQVDSIQKDRKIPVIDSGIVMNWIYTKSHHLNGRITDAQWERFNAAFHDKLYEDLDGERTAKNMLAAATVVYMKDTPRHCRQRIVKRAKNDPTREFEIKEYSMKYLRSLHRASEAFIREFKPQFGQFIEVAIPKIGNISTKWRRVTIKTEAAAPCDNGLSLTHN
jgi:deoxyadenosine/deoxycytidine kinase